MPELAPSPVVAVPAAELRALRDHRQALLIAILRGCYRGARKEAKAVRRKERAAIAFTRACMTHLGTGAA